MLSNMEMYHDLYICGWYSIWDDYKYQLMTDSCLSLLLPSQNSKWPRRMKKQCGQSDSEIILLQLNLKPIHGNNSYSRLLVTDTTSFFIILSLFGLVYVNPWLSNSQECFLSNRPIVLKKAKQEIEGKLNIITPKLFQVLGDHKSLITSAAASY